MDDNLKDTLSHFEMKALAQFEQKLPEVRAVYDDLDDVERARMLQWLTALDALCGAAQDHWNMQVLIHTHIETPTEDGPVFEGDHIELTPNVMLHAVQAWEKGEQFSPGGLFGTF